MAITNEDITRNLKTPSTWKRIFFMLIFAVIVSLVRILLWAAVLLQVAYALITGKPNPNVLKFGKLLAAYLFQILLFLTYNSDDVPFPFGEFAARESAGSESETHIP